MFVRRNSMMFSSRRMLHGMFREVQLVEDDCATVDFWKTGCEDVLKQQENLSS